MATIEERMARIEVRVGEIEDALEENTRTTKSIKADTLQIITLFQASKFGIALVRWMVLTGGALVMAYAAYKGLK